MTKVTATNTIGDVLRLGTYQISRLVRGEVDTTNGVNVFFAAIINLLEFHGIEWSNAQIGECASLCYDEYYWLTMGELKHFTTRIKTAYYGKVYGKFAPSTLMEWLSAYVDETWQVRAGFYGNRVVKDATPQTEEEKAMAGRVGALLADFATDLQSKISQERAKEQIDESRKADARIKEFQERQIKLNTEILDKLKTKKP